jgi:UDP-N-acetyl-D-galactosamine dehydrogenase
MGITFKENCPDIRNSKVIDLISELLNWTVKVVVTDPWADAVEVKYEYGLELSQLNASQKVDALVVAVAHGAFKSKSLPQLRALCSSENPVLADVKGLYDPGLASRAGFTVFRL